MSQMFAYQTVYLSQQRNKILASFYALVITCFKTDILEKKMLIVLRCPLSKKITGICVKEEFVGIVPWFAPELCVNSQRSMCDMAPLLMLSNTSRKIQLSSLNTRHNAPLQFQIRNCRLRIYFHCILMINMGFKEFPDLQR